ncbi:MAG: tubulin-like doman-containing protein, partial [Anaerolineae bacterium]|nr:tubulin-like doman-containing protein [Anaerolineae bacterium]
GRWLAYTHHNAPNGNSYSAREADVWLLDLSNGSTQPISANSSASDSWPTWSRDSRRLAFNTTARDPNFDIALVDVAADGSTSGAQLLAGASQPGIFEHLPFWGQVAARPSLIESLQDVLPFLLPLLILVALLVTCMFRRKSAVVAVPPLYNMPPPKPLRPLELQSQPLEILWKPQPTLVIGLGAAGWHTLTQLKKTLADAALGQPSPNVRLLAIVCGDANRLKHDDFSGLELSADELLEWRDELSAFLRQTKDDPTLRTWFDDRYQRQYPQAALNPLLGFQGNRPSGRLALIANLRGHQEDTGKSLWETLVTCARQVQDAARAETDTRPGEEKILNVLIVSDLSDDTASAIVNDVAYLLRRLRDQAELGITTVNIAAHLLTGRATQGRNMNDLMRSVNTQASLREVARFQLASLASFPMRYGRPELDGSLERILFDEIYLHDGERSPGPLNNF